AALPARSSSLPSRAGASRSGPRYSRRKEPKGKGVLRARWWGGWHHSAYFQFFGAAAERRKLRCAQWLFVLRPYQSSARASPSPPPFRNGGDRGFERANCPAPLPAPLPGASTSPPPFRKERRFQPRAIREP